jgi:hypothetical protein
MCKHVEATMLPQLACKNRDLKFNLEVEAKKNLETKLSVGWTEQLRAKLIRFLHFEHIKVATAKFSFAAQP